MLRKVESYVVVFLFVCLLVWFFFPMKQNVVGLNTAFILIVKHCRDFLKSGVYAVPRIFSFVVRRAFLFSLQKETVCI